MKTAERGYHLTHACHGKKETTKMIEDEEEMLDEMSPDMRRLLVKGMRDKHKEYLK